MAPGLIAAALGAFLLFIVQPMAAKQLLPLFGGGAAVWTVCLLFFQGALLAGYAYAHFTRPRVHIALLIASCAALPPAPNPSMEGDPAWGILRALAASIGGPYAMLASTSPLIQRWSGLANPFRLYAVSNAASMAGLLSYPFLVEPWMSLAAQRTAWSAGYTVFVLAGAWAAVRAKPAATEGLRAAPWPDMLTWIALAACGSGLLAAATNEICQEVAPVPFLWVIPLAIYLATFVIVFALPGLYSRAAFGLLAAAAIPASCVLTVTGTSLPLKTVTAVHLGTLFVCLMVAHGELARSRPGASRLTAFYLAVAAGGALGGVFVAIAAPRLFSTFAEFPLLLAATAVLAVTQRCRSGEFRGLGRAPLLTRATLGGLGVAIAAPLMTLEAGGNHVVERSRNFYGVLKVSDWKDKEGDRRTLAHGRTTHGAQFLDPARRRTPTAYYGWASAVGLAFDQHPRPGGTLRAGIIGLGAGTLARYARRGDVFRFYEINPDVERMARRHFTFLADSEGRIEVTAGDARLRLGEEPPGDYDILVVDAFSSDSIPTHLLTAECGEIYRRHLRKGGKILIHISNRALELEPVVRGMAAHIGLGARRVESPADPSQGVYSASWMVLEPGAPAPGAALTWTDDFTSLWRVLK